MTELAYNACDIVEYVNNNKTSNFNQANYVYIGSYFCDLYMLSIPRDTWERAITYIKKSKKQAVLVIPTPSQRNLEKLKRLASILMSDYSDVIKEIVINDYGMSRWLNNNNVKLPVWGGRMLSKELRDPRYPEKVQSNKILEWVGDGNLLGLSIIGIELDTSCSIEAYESLRIACHMPLNYITMGRYCEIGSINRPITEKFKLWSGCDRTCNKYWNRYENDEANFLKFGKAVYTYDICNKNNGSRTIYNGIKDYLTEVDYAFTCTNYFYRGCEGV